MFSLRKHPNVSWLHRFSVLLAVLLSALGLVMMMVGWLDLDILGPWRLPIEAGNATDGLCVFFLGLLLLALEVEWPGARWLVWIPIAITALLLAKDLLIIERNFAGISSFDATASPPEGPVPVMFLSCILLTCLVLAWRILRRGAGAQAFVEAAIGSVIATVGLATLLGYAAGLTAIHRWGMATGTAPISAAVLFLLGIGLLIHAWRHAVKSEGGPPAWTPMPAVIGCLTLTLILWIGLRERERAYVVAKAQTSMDTLATSITTELERQASAVERLARKWADAPHDENLWEQDALAQWEESSKNLGCVSIAMVNASLRTIWAFPASEKTSAVGFDHSTDEVRSNAIEAARIAGAPAITTSTLVAALGKGVVIYSPVFRDGRLSGYVAAEYLYRNFFGRLIADQKIEDDYSVRIRTADDTDYTSTIAPPRSGASAPILENTYTIFFRPVTIALTTSAAALKNDRLYLPELALGAGVGITLLLGLSVHFARRARAGQRAAELSNAKLQAENEERRRVEARLKVSDERLRLALDSTQIGIFEWNVPAGHVYYSPGLWAMLGYEHVRMPSAPESWHNLIHPDDISVYRRRVDSQLASLASFIEPEYRVRARNGEWRWVYTRSKTVATQDGKPLRIIGTVQDITARREAEQALRESQAEARKLSLVAAKTDNPVLIASPSGAIEWVNESFTRVMEYSLEEVVGKARTDFMDGPETDQRTVARIRAAMAHGQGISTDVVNYSKSGRKYHLRLQIQPIRDETDQLQNFIAIETDITARVETEQTLRRAKAEADEASRAKSEFVASMSHEIRTPMNGVIGMTSLLLETPLNPEQLDFINTIRTSGEALLTIINDILDFSKIESGKLELEHVPFELAVCIEEALDLFALQASAKKLEMVYHLAPDVPPWIMGDITRVRQVLVNLVNNAVKFTPRGSIVIEVQRLPVSNPGSSQLMLEFTVRDTGIGIPAERRDRLFKAFSQVDSSTTRKYGGTGLGLAISQRLSVLMGGGIRVESTEGQGSSFIFTVAAESAPQPITHSDGPDLRALRGATILCVEDQPMTQRRIRSVLEPYGATCVFASNSTSALALAPTLSPAPALLIIDGDEVGSRPPFAPVKLNVPRLLILPFGQTAPEIQPDGQPFATIFKPFKTASLLHTIGLLFNSPPTATISSNTASIFTPRLAMEFPLDVLLAEDNTVNQKVALRFLERLGYRADTVSNGLEALTTLEARHYHLVLMDLQMPEMDGLEASRQIRRRLSGDRQPKIIALTANAMQGDRERCIEAGMDDYISKPVKLHEIETAIRRLFGKPDDSPTPQN